jgi:putative FmdB family regulatory protein
MPIYAYRCSACGHAQDHLQKMSEDPLSTCPACGAAAYTKQVTAAGFQLKGSGWYVTDFRGDGKKKEAAADKPAAETGAAGKAAEAGASPAASPAAPAPAPAPASAPSSD